MTGLAITALKLSHFRNHRATSLHFDGRPAAIIGPNGAGKTNILEAVSLLSPGRGLRRATPEAMARLPERIGWKVVADLKGVAAAHHVETWADWGGARQTRVDDKPVAQLALGRILRVLWLIPAMDRLWIESAEGRRRFLDRIAMSFFPAHAEAALAYEKAMRERNRLLKDGQRDPSWYAALEGRMAQAGQVLTDNRKAAIARLAAAQEGAQTAFPFATLSLTHAEPLPDDLAEGLGRNRSRDMAAGRSLIGPHRADLGAIYDSKGMAAEHCSTGEQKALLLSVILANARALRADIGQAPVLLLDEVAAHLDESRRHALYDEVLAMQAQALMTGTEAALFDSLGARAQVLRLQDSGQDIHIE